MILICPSCGAAHSAEGWENDATARQALQASTKLPASVNSVLLAYLGLFRPSKQALRWSKSLKMINELSAMIAQGHIQIQGKVARPCPPHLWAQAMEAVADRRATLILPLKNHNYLRQVAYQIADQADAGRERTQNQQVLNGNAQAHRDVQQPVQAPVDDGLSQLERQYLAKHGHLPGMDGEGAITCPADLAAWARKNFAPDDDQC
jgi:hypothetical protein